MRKIALFTMILILCLSDFSFAATVSFSYGMNSYRDPIAPRLRYPINETVILAGDSPLEFSWWNDLMNTRGFILKVYKGYNMYGANLILKEELSQGASSYIGQRDLFKDGQVYTWSLVRVSNDGFKSDRSFNSFKIIKK